MQVKPSWSIRGTGCRAARNLLWDYVTERLCEGPMETVERHIARCQRCRQEAESMRRASRVLEAYAHREPPPSRTGWASLRTRLLAEERRSFAKARGAGRSPRPTRLRIAVAIAALIGFVAIGGRAHRQIALDARSSAMPRADAMTTRIATASAAPPLRDAGVPPALELSREFGTGRDAYFDGGSRPEPSGTRQARRAPRGNAARCGRTVPLLAAVADHHAARRSAKVTWRRYAESEVRRAPSAASERLASYGQDQMQQVSVDRQYVMDQLVAAPREDDSDF